MFGIEGSDACEADSVAYHLEESMSDRKKRYDAWLWRNPSHPGRQIHQGWLEPVDGASEGVSLCAASQELVVSRTAPSRVLNGHSGISVGLALKLEAAG